MLITLSRRTTISKSIAEVDLTGVAHLGAVNHTFNFLNEKKNKIDYSNTKSRQMLHYASAYLFVRFFSSLLLRHLWHNNAVQIE